MHVSGRYRLPKILPHHFREAGWVAIGQVLVVIGTLATIKVLTGFLTPDQYGEISLANTVVSLVSLLAYGPLSVAVTRYWSVYRKRGQASVLISQSAVLSFLVSLGVVAFCAVMFGLARSYFQVTGWAYLLLPTILFAILSGQNTLARSLHLAARNRIVYALSGGFQPWLYILFATLIMLSFGATSENALWGAALSMLVVAGVQVILILRTVASEPKRSHSGEKTLGIARHELLAFSLPFAATGILSWIQSSSDRWILQLFRDSTTVGNYAVVFQLGYYPIALLSGMLIQYMYPIILDNIGDGTNELGLRRGLRILSWGIGVFLLFSLIAVVVGAIFHVMIFHIITSDQYWSISYLLPMMVIWSALFGLSQLLALAPMALANPKVLVMPKIIAATLTVVLSPILVWAFGLVGVIVAGIGSALVYSLFMALIARRSIQAAKRLFLPESV